MLPEDADAQGNPVPSGNPRGLPDHHGNRRVVDAEERGLRACIGRSRLSDLLPVLAQAGRGQGAPDDEEEAAVLQVSLDVALVVSKKGFKKDLPEQPIDSHAKGHSGFFTRIRLSLPEGDKPCFASAEV